MKLLALMYTPAGITVQSAIPNASYQLTYPHCKAMTKPALHWPCSILIYAMEQDVDEARSWLETFAANHIASMIEQLPETREQMLSSLKALNPEPEPITLWIIPEIVAAIVNNDLSGLSPVEMNQIEQFERTYNHIVAKEFSESRWTQCAVTKLVGNCIPVYYDPKLSNQLKELLGAA